MRAWRLVGVGEPLQLCEVPVPRARPGWVVVRVDAAGLCHSDLHLLHGAKFASGTGSDLSCEPPITLGHEIAGTIIEVGEDVEGWAPGDRVVSGNDPSNAGLGSPGNTIDGGFADYCAIPAARLMSVPEGLAPSVAAVATDSINTAYFAVTVTGRLAAGERVGIVGLGGLGMSALRTAVLIGGSAYGVDVNTACFPAARAAGAVGCFQMVEDLRPVEPELIVDFVGSSETVAASLASVAMGGRVVVVGLASKAVSVDIYDLILGEKSMYGSHGGDFGSLRTALALARSGGLAPETVPVPFEELDEAYGRLERGEVGPRRLVTKP